MAKDTSKSQVKKASKKLHTILKVTEQTIAENGDFDTYQNDIKGRLAKAGLTSEVGTIAYAGRTASGHGQVQLTTASGVFASTWPEWAYDVGKTAVCFNRKVWVIYSGSPMGENLLQVLCMREEGQLARHDTGAAPRAGVTGPEPR